MMITRCCFLKSAAAAVALAVGGGKIPAAAFNVVEPQPVSGREYGNCVPANPPLEKAVIKLIVKRFLLPDARKTVGRGCVVEIRVSNLFDHGRSSGIAWYTNDRIKKASPHRVEKPLYVKEHGYLYCGRLVT